MFKIDKSFVEYIDNNKSIVVIKQWALKENLQSDTAEDISLTSDDRPAHDLKDDPQQIIMQAKQEAEHILLQASEEAEEKKEAAYEEGFALGKQEAQKQFQQLKDEMTTKWNRLVTEQKEFHKQMEQELEENILQLSLDIAEKIVNVQLERDDIVFVEMVKRAIGQLNVKDGFTLRLNQREYEKYFAKDQEWLQNELHCPPFTVLKDGSILPGGCVFESDDGVVKAGVDAQIKMISIALNQEKR